MTKDIILLSTCLSFSIFEHKCVDNSTFLIRHFCGQLCGARGPVGLIVDRLRPLVTAVPGSAQLSTPLNGFSGSGDYSWIKEKPVPAGLEPSSYCGSLVQLYH